MRVFYRYEMIDALSPPLHETMNAEGLLATILFFLFVLSIFLIIFSVTTSLLPFVSI